MKTCSSCNQEKHESEFNKKLDGLTKKCKPCIKEYRKLTAERDREKNREYHRIHKQEITDRKREYFRKYPEKRPKHADLCKNLNYKLAHNLRARLRNALKQNNKTGSAVDLLGCSIPELRVYLEKKFSLGMSWYNYGPDGWHIDHILPLANYDLSIHENVKMLCHHSNLQPLWSYDNLSKHNN